MGLLNPLLLLLVGAAAIPLLLHLFQRHQGPRFTFPALRYLRRAEKESARRIKLRQILLMLLRVAAILLLAFAAARPFIRVGGTSHSPTAVVIILDNSMSTAVVEGERRVIDELRDRALEVLADAGVDDTFWLLRAGQPDEPALAGDAATTAMRVRETEPTAAAANLPAAIAHARTILASGAGSRAAEIHLLTDLQSTGFVTAAPPDSAAPPVIVWHPGTTPPTNRSVTSVEIAGGMAPIAGQRTTVAATVGGDASDDTIAVRMEIDGRLTAATGARQGETAILAVPPRQVGVMIGSVEIDADALHADDRRYFATRVLPPPAVALTGEQPFVADALEVLQEADRIQRATTRADIAILDAGAGAESHDASTALVVVPPVSPTELAAVNRRMTSAGIPWRYLPPTAGEARFDSVQSDPLLRGLVDARVRQVYPLERTAAAGTDSVLIRLSDGSAWAVRGTRSNGGTYVLLGSPMSAEGSTLPTSALMLPLLDRITGAWARAVSPHTDAAPGSEVAIPAGPHVVQRPDGTRDEVEGETTYRFGTEPGVYRIMRDDSIIAAYAINPPAAESDLARLDRRELEAQLDGWTLHVTDSPGAWKRAAYRERVGREIWRPLLLALLAVLVVESIIAAAGRGGASTARTPSAEKLTADADAG